MPARVRQVERDRSNDRRARTTSDDAPLAMLETVLDRLDLIEAQANMHSEAMTQIAEIALLAYAASGADALMPEASTASTIVERAIGRHPDQLKAMQRGMRCVKSSESSTAH